MLPQVSAKSAALHDAVRALTDELGSMRDELEQARIKVAVQARAQEALEEERAVSGQLRKQLLEIGDQMSTLTSTANQVL